MGTGNEVGEGTRSELPVADSSSLIALHQLGLLDLLRELYGEVNIPPAVEAELHSIPDPPDWLSVLPLTDSLPESLAGRSLHPGEAEALRLCLETRAALLITDDLAARKTALRLGVPVVGVLGILIVAKQAGLISEVRSYIEALLGAGFRLGQTVCTEALASAGEEPSELLASIEDEP